MRTLLLFLMCLHQSAGVTWSVSIDGYLDKHQIGSDHTGTNLTVCKKKCENDLSCVAINWHPNQWCRLRNAVKSDDLPNWTTNTADGKPFTYHEIVQDPLPTESPATTEGTIKITLCKRFQGVSGHWASEYLAEFNFTTVKACAEECLRFHPSCVAIAVNAAKCRLSQFNVTTFDFDPNAIAYQII